MTSAQGDRQSAVRALTGTAYTYEGDWEVLFSNASVSPDGGFNGRLLAWINTQLGSSYTEINGAMAAYAAANGSTNWSSMGGLGAGNLLSSLSWVAGTATTLSTAAGRARATGTDVVANPPRIVKGPFAIISGKTYAISGVLYTGTMATNVYFRVGSASGLPAGDVKQIPTGGVGSVTLTGNTFVAGYTGNAWAGIVGVGTANAQYCEIDDAVSVVQL